MNETPRQSNAILTYADRGDGTLGFWYGSNLLAAIPHDRLPDLIFVAAKILRAGAA